MYYYTGGVKVVSVIGASNADEQLLDAARAIGKLAAQYGFAVATGGLDGVMSEAFIGAKDAGGLTIGLIPSYSKHDANDYCDICIPTGLGHARNILVASTGDLVFSIGGEFGTLSEIAIALKLNKKVISFRSPHEHADNYSLVKDFLEAAEKALEHLC